MAGVAKVKSIQAQRNKRGHKSRVASLNDETLRHAYNHGTPWTDDEVEAIANLISRDATTFDMALAVGRSYYSTQTTRSHVRFAMNHARVFRGFLPRTR